MLVEEGDGGRRVRRLEAERKRGEGRRQGGGQRAEAMTMQLGAAAGVGGSGEEETAERKRKRRFGESGLQKGDLGARAGETKLRDDAAGRERASGGVWSKRRRCLITTPSTPAVPNPKAVIFPGDVAVQLKLLSFKIKL